VPPGDREGATATPGIPYFMPVVLIPSTMYLRVKRYKTMGGIIIIEDMAMRRSHRTMNMVREKLYEPTLRGFRFSESMKTRGMKNSFHQNMDERTPMVTNMGRARGTMILQNICQLLQPSILAASSSSFGIVL
jgi:hypothetical protein